jgi:hypothetical protein
MQLSFRVTQENYTCKVQGFDSEHLQFVISAKHNYRELQLYNYTDRFGVLLLLNQRSVYSKLRT